MMRSAARMRAWLLAAAPVMVLSALRWHAGGAAAALLLWLGTGALLPCRYRYPYPRKRNMPLSRLFFGFAVTAFFTAAAAAAVDSAAAYGDSFVTSLLKYAGAVGFSLPVGKRALSLPLPPRLSWGAGALLCAFLLMFLLAGGSLPSVGTA